MKKIITTTLLLFLAIVGMQAEIKYYFNVKETNTGKVNLTIAFDKNPKITYQYYDDLAFENIRITADGMRVYSLSANKNYTIYYTSEGTVPTAISSALANSGLNIEGGVAVISGLNANEPVAVFNASGAKVAAVKADANGAAVIDLNAMPDGVLIIKAANSTFKMKK